MSWLQRWCYVSSWGQLEYEPSEMWRCERALLQSQRGEVESEQYCSFSLSVFRDRLISGCLNSSLYTDASLLVMQPAAVVSSAKSALIEAVCSRAGMCLQSEKYWINTQPWGGLVLMVTVMDICQLVLFWLVACGYFRYKWTIDFSLVRHYKWSSSLYCFCWYFLYYNFFLYFMFKYANGTISI